MLSSKKTYEEAQKLLMDGKLNESIDTFTRAIYEGERSEISYLSRGVAHLKNNEKRRAVDDFSTVEMMNDENVRAHFYKGIAHLTMKEMNEAIAEFDRTIELDPDNGAAFFARGSAYAELGNEELATKNIKTAISFSEAGATELQETIGLWRTEFDKAVSIVSGYRNTPELNLSKEEYDQVMNWLGESYLKEKFH